MCARRVACAAVLLGVLFVGARARAADPPRLTLTAPASLVGDGESVARVSVVVVPPSLASAPSDLRVTVSAGTVRAVRRADQGRFDIDYVPPRVARDSQVQIEAASVTDAVTARPASVLVTRPVQKTEKATGGPLDLRVPELLVLGSDDSVDVSTRKPASGTVVVKTNVGSLSDVREAADGRLHATYRPPTDKFPHIAIVAAMTGDGAVLDWSSIALYGAPQVNATTDPNATVRAKVGSRVFGPFRADASGQTNIDVLAPPGETAAEVVATDAQGNDHYLRLPLGAPPFGHGFAMCVPGDERIWLIAVGDAGAGRSGLAWKVTSSGGGVETPVAAGRGVYEARLQIPEGAASGEAVDLYASAVGRDKYDSACRCPVLGEPPTAIDVRLDPPAFGAGSGRPVQIVAELRYSGRRHPRRVALEAAATLGNVRGVTFRSSTEVVATWDVPDRFGEAQRARVSFRTRTRPEVGGESTLELRSGRLARLDIAWGGAGSTTVSVGAFDSFGNRAQGAKLTVRARGTVGELRQGPVGRYVIDYRPPLGGSDEIFVQDLETGVSASRRIDTGRVAPFAWARVGYTSNFGRVRSPMAAAGAAARLPWLERAIAVGVEAGYWGNRSSATDGTTAEVVETSVAVVPITGRVTLERPVGRIVPYVGGAVGAVLAQTGIRSPTVGDVKKSNAAFGAAGFGGVGLGLGPGRAGLEVGYFGARIDNDIVQGNSGGLQLTAGYQLDL